MIDPTHVNTDADYRPTTTRRIEVSQSLYAIVNDIQFLLDSTNEEGEMPPGVEEELDKLQHDLPIKADNIAAYMRTRQARADSFAAELDRLKKLQATEQRAADRLKKYLFDNLTSLNITKLETDRFAFSVCRNSVPTTTLAEGADVPAEYQRVRIELDSKKVVEDFKAGKPLPPTLTCAVGSHLRIR